MPTPPTLSDGVVTLRRHREDDAQGSFEQCQDPLSQAWTTVPVPYSLADARGYVTQMLPAGWEQDTEWAFAIESEGRYGGTVSLRNEGDGRAEIAYGAHPAIRGTDTVERALRLLVEWGFAEQKLHTIIWWSNTGNWASRKVAWRLGFSFDGTVRRWLPQRGELRDGWVGTLLREDPREPRTTWLDNPVLDGEGLRLRPLEDRDCDRIVEACSEERTQHWLGLLPAPYTLEDARTYLASRTEQLAAGTGATWAVVDPADDVLLATVGYFDHVPGIECEIGYWTHPRARGRGVMTRAVRVLTGYAFETLGVNRVRMFAAVDNAASRHVIEANGLTQSGIERLGAEIRTGRADLAIYDVLAAEFVRRCAASDHSSTPIPAIDSTAPTTAGAR